MSAMNFISRNGTTLEAFEETDLDHTRCKSEAPRALNSPRRGISGFQEGACRSCRCRQGKYVRLVN
jgi:hypothetical protein